MSGLWWTGAETVVVARDSVQGHRLVCDRLRQEVER